MALLSGWRHLTPLLSLSLLVAVTTGCQSANVPPTMQPDASHDQDLGNKDGGAVSLALESGSARNAQLYQVDVFEIGPEGERLVSTQTLDAVDGTVLRGMKLGQYRLRATPISQDGMPTGEPLSATARPTSSGNASRVMFSRKKGASTEVDAFARFPTPIDEFSHTSMLLEENVERARAEFNVKFPIYANKQGLEFGESLDPGFPASVPDPGEFDKPLPFVKGALLARFNNGKNVFLFEPTREEGVGPQMNYHGCVGCHFTAGGVGGGDDGNQVRLVPRFGHVGHDGTFDALLDKGGLVMQRDRIGFPPFDFVGGDEEGNVTVRESSGNPDQVMPFATFLANFLPQMDYEQVPDEANTVSKRFATLVFGDGLVEAVPDSVFFELADAPQKKALGILGRPNLGDRVPIRGLYGNRKAGGNQVGRFGRKAQAPTLEDFNTGAMLNEVGLATEQQPFRLTRNGPTVDAAPEIAPELIDDLNTFSRFLAPPFPDGSGNPEGEKVFKGIGCASCHIPTLTTGKNSIGMPEGIEFHPYSDFLLHKMGPTLADRIVEAGAAGDEWRTPPLWGLRLREHYLHDARTTSLDEAILMHASAAKNGVGNSEANAVIGRYRTLGKIQKAALLHWLKHQ